MESVNSLNILLENITVTLSIISLLLRQKICRLNAIHECVVVLLNWYRRKETVLKEDREQKSEIVTWPGVENNFTIYPVIQLQIV